MQEAPKAAGKVRRVRPAWAVPEGREQVLANRQPKGAVFRHADAPPGVAGAGPVYSLV